MDVEIFMDVDVEIYVDVAKWHIPWAVELTPVLAMIPTSSIFTDEADALHAPQEQACIPGEAQDAPPWLTDIFLEGIERDR